jgi:hypothetical protein
MNQVGSTCNSVGLDIDQDFDPNLIESDLKKIIK